MRTPFFFGLLVLAWWAGAQDLPSPLVKAVLVDGGTFPQGKRTLDPAAEGRTVTVSSFWMAEAEVTQSQYRAVTGQSPSRFSGEVNPVERVSWYDAVAFCNALSEKEGLKAVYTIDGTKVTADWTATGWRLPTEAEWEFAARGGTHSQGFAFSGSDEADKVGYGFYNSGKRTSPVKSLLPNELGIYGLSGNVWEWCWDWYEFDRSNLPATDPRGPAVGTDKVNRGGGWNDDFLDSMRPYFRADDGPDAKDDDLGFRIVRNAP